ncbi:MAG: bifunctional 5,10-methylene-tetrahydrofolate dehydrogenase/5,10-methylene-tetrahydrofolate cyclohydrolase, partial [Armatimonadetes bacterium]|nr:bifunctional 5,10-methylene-tetrahydrofolate dehydrogenase/5,10-methylene-tetrahydrofolate cyclohydrolase [Akkermansiaceae bacterium]
MNRPRILDGKAVSAAVIEECREETAALIAMGITPGLAVVLVGSDPASQVYVGSKARTCAGLGFHSLKIELPEETTQAELLQVVRELNADPAVHGILVQFPLPQHISEETVIRALDPRKDVDGFHPENVAKLVLEDPSG